MVGVIRRVVLPDVCSSGVFGDVEGRDNGTLDVDTFDIDTLVVWRVGVKAELGLVTRSTAGTFMGSVVLTVGDCRSIGWKPRGDVAADESLLLLGDPCESFFTKSRLFAGLNKGLLVLVGLGWEGEDSATTPCDMPLDTPFNETWPFVPSPGGPRFMPLV